MNPGSPAEDSGLKCGDVLIGIGPQSTVNPPMSHRKASDTIKYAGNELNVTVQRNHTNGDYNYFNI